MTGVKLFLSYEQSDRALARQLFEALQARGRRAWFDEHEIIPGQDLHQAVSTALHASEGLIAMVTSESLKSQWVKSEINFALGSRAFKHRVFPVVGSDELIGQMPWILRRFRVLRLEPDDPGTFHRAAEAIARSLEAGAHAAAG